MGYHSTVAASSVTAAATLPYTGMPLMWAALAGFAVFAAGVAVRRMLPKEEA